METLPTKLKTFDQTHLKIAPTNSESVYRNPVPEGCVYNLSNVT